MDDVVNDFLVESHENLERLDRAFLSLERDPSATAVIADVFRTIHTIKGTCGFLGLSKLERLSHSGESLLARLRDGEKRFDAEISQALFEMVDGVRAILASIESSGAEGEASYEPLIAELEALCADEPAHAALPSEPSPGASEEKLPAAPVPPSPKAEHVAPASIRVDVDHLDRLMNLVGELVLARNQIHLQAEGSEHSGLRASAQRLALITGELQDSVMRTRMQPIGNAWAKVPRLVRDLCAQLGKRVRVELSGAETAIDRSILEALRDPLTHMVRNSIDHGIEAPALRAQAGKPAEGTLRFCAWTEGGQVRLTIEDDGAGIDPQRVRKKAEERGLISSEEAALMGEAGMLGLIFRPGFSTADAVSHLSGRGVGMDVVKTNLERLGGSVNVSSTVGAGTRIELRIPLTLAILPALLVECAGQRFALPAGSVIELARIPGPLEAHGIESVHGASVLRLRGGLLPLVSLRALLCLPRATAPEHDAFAVVLEVEGKRFGLLVDSLRDIEEIVVKPLGEALERLGLYAGATIQGDGRVALILDVPTLARRGKVHRVLDPARIAKAASRPAEPALQVLVLEVDGSGRGAIDLARVRRLEQLSRDQIEQSCGQPVLQWRDEVVPLVSLRSCLGTGAAEPSSPDALDGHSTVVICDVDGRHLGLIVERVLDVVEVLAPMRDVLGVPWSRGQTLLLGRVTDVLDIDALARAVFERMRKPMSFA